ncbi:MAG: DUF2934 domain-containing protein [Bacteriovoracaceae bacterium]|nr:DUF2934 domain-containing protein [Bacteriovoracaceae bacterium]
MITTSGSTNSKRVTSKKRTPAASKPKQAIGAITFEQKQNMIATVAYEMAQQRGFAEGNQLEDWLAAESEIDKILKHL